VKKLFITFGSNQFKIQRKHLVNLVKKTEVYDYTIAFSPEDLSSDFQSTFGNILKIEKGFGNWIWKADILKQTLKQMNQGDSLTYSSAGSSFNNLGIERLKHYFDLLESSNTGNLRFKLPELYEREWTSKQIFEYFNIPLTSKIALGEQYAANTFMMKKNKTSEKIVNEFLNLLYSDENLITNYYDSINQIDEFKENRNDQSILSVLSKIHEVDTVLIQEQNFARFDMNQYNYPFLSVRKKKYNLFQKLIFYINFKKNINKPIYFYKKISLLEKIIYHFKKLLKRQA